MFSFAALFNQDLNAWSLSKVTNMKQMFKESLLFNGQVGSWNTERVTDAEEMFCRASAFDQSPAFEVTIQESSAVLPEAGMVREVC